MSEFLSKIAMSRFKYGFIALIVFVLYGNTLNNGFALDDSIVITENIYTQKGLSGIREILTTDSFQGFFKDEGKKDLVSGGRYRPLSVVFFAIEYQFFGNNAFLSHFITILWYAALCVMVLITLNQLFKDYKNGPILSMLTTLLFAAHPVHTEVVANIKGRDEILSLLFSVSAFYYVLRFHDEKRNKHLLLASVMMFLGLLSKEITITFLAVIPLAVWLFRSEHSSGILKSFVAIFIPSILFVIIRQSIVGNSLDTQSLELLNNPFLKWNGTNYIPFSGAEKLATVVYTWLLYFQILIGPVVLTHDYYPKHIEMMRFSDWQVILSIAVHIILAVLAVFNFRKNKIITFSIVFYFATFSIVSNLFFPIGTFMAERFLFTPSLGFALICSVGLLRLEEKYKSIALVCLGILILLYGIKTVNRNKAWKDNYTLFSTDIKHSPNSAKLLNAIGGSTIDKYKDEKVQALKDKHMDEAIAYLNQSLEIHPTNSGADLLIGNALFYKNDFQGAVDRYRKMLVKSPDNQNAKRNLALVLRDFGKYSGETLNDLDKALMLLNESYTMAPDDLETARLLAVANGMKGNHDEVIRILEAYLLKDSGNPNVLFNLSRAYAFKGDLVREKYYLDKAIALDPNILKGK